jgi:hypothetical protein
MTPRVIFAAVIALTATPLMATQAPSNTCTVSPTVYGTAPADPGADPVRGTFYANDDSTLWVSVPRDGWPAGGQTYNGGRPIPGQKTYWVRPKGTALAITGRRLDGEAPAVEAHVPCCYPSGFQIVSLHFPTAGCWEVKATAGDRELTFVTQVRPPAPTRGQ